MKVKQFKHYCQKLGLKPECIRRFRENVFYLKGKGRRWRFFINEEDNQVILQVSCVNSEFDRWANSLHATNSFNINEFTFTKMKKFVLDNK